MSIITNASFLAPFQQPCNSATAASYQLKQMIDVLLASGRWEVTGWSDNKLLRHGRVEHRLSTWKVNGSWVTIRALNADNAVGDKQEWCLILTATNNGSFSVKHSRAAGFTGGGTHYDPDCN